MKNKKMTTRDKLPIIGSLLGGYSLLPESDYVIGYMHPDGNVNWGKLNWLLQGIANRGATGIRLFPPWPTDHEGWENLKPFSFELGHIVWNDLYFENLTKIFRLCYEQYNLTPIYDLFNSSETRVIGDYDTKLHSPWNLFEDYFYGDDSHEVRYGWINRVVDASYGIPVSLGVCNEPPSRALSMMISTYTHLIHNGIDPGRIIVGWDAYRKKIDENSAKSNLYDDGGKYVAAYRNWRDKVTEILEVSTGLKKEEIEKMLKSESWHSIHNANVGLVQDYFQLGLEEGQTVPSNSDRPTIYSTDGIMKPRLTEQQAAMVAREVMYIKMAAVLRGNVELEAIIGKETGIDMWACINGFAKIIAKKFRLQNLRKYPEPLPLPYYIIPPEIVEPEPVEKSIKILSPESPIEVFDDQKVMIKSETKNIPGDLIFEWSPPVFITSDGESWIELDSLFMLYPEAHPLHSVKFEKSGLYRYRSGDIVSNVIEVKVNKREQEVKVEDKRTKIPGLKIGAILLMLFMIGMAAFVPGSRIIILAAIAVAAIGVGIGIMKKKKTLGPIIAIIGYAGLTASLYFAKLYIPVCVLGLVSFIMWIVGEVGFYLKGKK